MHLLLERRRVLADPFPRPKPALFLDRDGVLIEDKHHLCTPDEVVLCPSAKTLLAQAKRQEWPVVLITNQSGIARGYFDWEVYERVTDRLLDLLGSTAPLAAIYANGHGPDAPTTSWRKPSPAMLFAAAEDLQLDLSRSMLIGDRLSDLEAGAQAGVPSLAHVLTGHGAQERSAVEHWANQNEISNGQNGYFELTLLQSLAEVPFHRLTASR